jgi:hypothetical protein
MTANYRRVAIQQAGEEPDHFVGKAWSQPFLN